VREYVRTYFEFGRRADLARDMYATVRMSSGPRHLAQLPLLLAILCHEKAHCPDLQLPTTRTEFLRRALMHMLESGDRKRREPEPREDRDENKIRLLRHIAWRFYDSGPCPMPRKELLAVLKSALKEVGDDFDPDERPSSAKSVLNEFLQDGVLVERGLRVYGFVLRSFHEFCLAGWIAHESPVCDDRDQFTKMLQEDDGKWSDQGPFSDPDWYHVWPLVAGQMGERGEWLLKAVDVPMLGECFGYRGHARIFDVPASIAAELDEGLDARKRFVDSLAEDIVSSTMRCEGDEEWSEEWEEWDEEEYGPEEDWKWLKDLKKEEDRRDREREDSTDRMKCANAMIIIGDQRRCDLFIQRLGDPTTMKDIRTTCAFVLGRLGGEQSREALIEQLRSPRVDYWFLQAVDWIFETTNPEREISEAVQAACASALGQIGCERSRDALIAGLDDPDMGDNVRIECALALGEIGCERSRDALIAGLGDLNLKDDVRKACISALGRIGCGHSRETLIAGRDDPNLGEDLRRECATALWRSDAARSHFSNR
jgi:hypothetical protein